MGTYLDMQTRIADEVRSGVSSQQIKNAILDAVKEYERRKWWFNQATYPGLLTDENNGILTDETGQPLTDYGITLQPGRDTYSSADMAGLATWPTIASVLVVYGTNRYTLTSRTWGWIEDNSVSNLWRSSIPSDYAYAEEMLRIFPVPAQALQLVVRGVQRLTALSGDTDSNAWTNEAEALIRCRASSILFRRILRDPETASIWDAEEGRTLSGLLAENARRGGAPRIKPYY